MTNLEPGTRKVKPRDITVLVAMSGGVDSSVAAAVLQEQGYRVVGVTMLLWPEDVPGAEEGCCGTVHLNDARSVCSKLGIAHYTLDLQAEFLSDVVRPFVDTYLAGRTPNPCIRCNEHLKFRHLIRKARGVGADLLATGHYARIVGKNPWRLARGADDRKDQSYFLFTLRQKELARLLFPLGNMKKDLVRRKAEAFGLPVHAKAESQEICFVPDGGLRDFIREKGANLPGPGKVVDTGGNELGTHEGACFYTVGQRKGLGIAAPEPLYVMRIDGATNTVVVGKRAESAFPGLKASGSTWIEGHPPGERFTASVQIRHRHTPAPSTVTVNGDGSVDVIFDEPQHGVAPGQAVVVYDGEYVLGGGWITEPMAPSKQ
ncbi:MAG: tRNA 2-thiouridine(34) synthase MnmA [bacterium]|nr:tRNA 2-thiouridine(34) synthase MnmA [bacterium]MDT8396769.1 tRNA 2-thiouridine(34) synthase MnmA [bacterium]